MRMIKKNVQWKTFGDIGDVITGGELPQDCIKVNIPQGNYSYPVWGNGKDIYGYAKTYKVNTDAVCISSIGAMPMLELFSFIKQTLRQLLG